MRTNLIMTVIAAGAAAATLNGCGSNSGNSGSARTTIKVEGSTACGISGPTMTITILDGTGAIIGSGTVPRFKENYDCGFRGTVPTSKSDEYVVVLGTDPESTSARKRVISAEQLAAQHNTVTF